MYPSLFLELRDKRNLKKGNFGAEASEPCYRMYVLIYRTQPISENEKQQNCLVNQLALSSTSLQDKSWQESEEEPVVHIYAFIL